MFALWQSVRLKLQRLPRPYVSKCKGVIRLRLERRVEIEVKRPKRRDGIGLRRCIECNGSSGEIERDAAVFVGLTRDEYARTVGPYVATLRLAECG